MDENSWSIDNIQAFYEHALKSKGLPGLPDDVILQCWTCLQVVTSLDDLSPSAVHLEGLLSSSSVRSLCLEQHEFWSRLGFTLLNSTPSNYASSLLAQLVQRIYDSGSQMHSQLMEKIWVKRGEVKLSVKALEQIVKSYPSFLEASLLRLLLNENGFLSTKALWSQPGNSSIIRLAAESPEVFQAATSIMNEIFIQTKLSAHIVEFIQTFLKGVRSVHKADPNGFISLYPLRLQFLVTLLSTKKQDAFKKELETVDVIVHHKLKELLRDDIKGFLCLAVHFPAASDTFQSFKS